MDDATIWIIPEAPAPQTSAPAASRSATGSALRIGILDNAKSNADYLLATIVEGIKSKLPVGSVVSLRKPGPATGATAEVLDQLVREADYVVSAMAD
jgi:hypothetical protein